LKADVEDATVPRGAAQMEKVGRNDACPCGSGKKFKRCCLEQVEKDERIERRTVERDRLVAEGERVERELATAKRAEAAADEIGRRSGAVLELIEAGRVDEAEAAARQFVAEVPDSTAAIERLGRVYEAKGQQQAASDEYRRAVAMMDARGDGRFCDCCRARMVRAIRRLDPERPAPALGRDPQ
jgi:tetratricopeptide (TPR) repeat protein